MLYPHSANDGYLPYSGRLLYPLPALGSDFLYYPTGGSSSASIESPYPYPFLPFSFEGLPFAGFPPLLLLHFRKFSFPVLSFRYMDSIAL